MDGTDVVGVNPWHRHRQTRIQYRRPDRPLLYPRPQALRCRQPRLAPLLRCLRLRLLLQALLQARPLGRLLLVCQAVFQPQARLPLPCRYPQLLLVHQPLV